MMIIVNGACGRMGREVIRLAGEAGHTIAGMVDTVAAMPGVVTTFEECGEADIIIDFSFHTAVKAVLEAAIARNCAAVICTTGHTPEELAMIANAADKVPVFHSGNMSVGVALLCRLANQTAKMFPEADVEIVEIHHKHKKDAPSGTAKMLFNAVKDARTEAEMVCGRSGICPRTPNEVGIASLRMGEIVGIHEVHVSTGTQTITLKHEAHSRALFAEGAICAAEFLVGQAAGKYDMNSIL